MNLPLIAAIKEQMDFLTDAEKKVAQYITNNYQDVIYFTVSELADQSGSSEATIVRFCKSMGYRGFQDFKINVAKYTSDSLSGAPENLELDDTPAAIKRKVFNSRIQALTDTQSVLSDKEFERAVDMLEQADRIEIFGAGASAYVAMDMKHKFLKCGMKCGVDLDADTQVMSASLLKKGDVAIGISYSGRSYITIRSLRLAKERGATTITLTGHARSPILKVSDVVLFTTAKETLYKSEAFASRIAEITVLDALLMAVSMRKYEDTQNAICLTRYASSQNKL